MTPGKLPHAQRLNVQKDDECRRNERRASEPERVEKKTGDGERGARRVQVGGNEIEMETERKAAAA